MRIELAKHKYFGYNLRIIKFVIPRRNGVFYFMDREPNGSTERRLPKHRLRLGRKAGTLALVAVVGTSAAATSVLTACSAQSAGPDATASPTATKTFKLPDSLSDMVDKFNAIKAPNVVDGPRSGALDSLTIGCITIRTVIIGADSVTFELHKKLTPNGDCAGEGGDTTHFSAELDDGGAKYVLIADRNQGAWTTGVEYTSVTGLTTHPTVTGDNTQALLANIDGLLNAADSGTTQSIDGNLVRRIINLANPAPSTP